MEVWNTYRNLISMQTLYGQLQEKIADYLPWIAGIGVALGMLWLVLDFFQDVADSEGDSED